MTSLLCPNCGSENIRIKNIAKKTGGAIGVVAGGASGIAGAMNGARLGFVVGAVGGPVGAFAGSLAGAALGCILGAAVGREVGMTVGGLVDDHLLNNYECLSCSHAFGSDDPISSDMVAETIFNITPANISPASPDTPTR